MTTYWIEIATVLFMWISMATLCGYIASQKNRDTASWAILGAFFGIYSLIAIACVPSLPHTETSVVATPELVPAGDPVPWTAPW